MAFLHDRKQRVVLGEIISEWVEVKSGVPQGSVLGPLLFVIYINGLPDNLNTCCKMYADDTKLLARLRPGYLKEDASLLQQDIDRVHAWTETWLMRLNLDKCKLMHIGKNNPETTYTLKNYNNEDTFPIKVTNSERDLGVQITNNLKFSEQVNIATSKAFKMLGLLKSTFSHRGQDMWKRLYTTYIRPQIEYAIPVWNPYLKADIARIEQVQRKATKVSHELRNLSYVERCSRLGLSTHADRRVRGDLIQKFKFEKGIDIIDWHQIPTSLPPRGGHRSHYEPELVRNCTQRLYFFNNRIARRYNQLSDATVNSATVNAFKNKLDNYEQTL